MICSWCILIYKKEIIWRFVHLPNLVTTSQDCFLYYLSVWKIFSKNSFFSRSQGVSLSIADAKVDTFNDPTKHYGNFFTTIFTRKSQCADLQQCRRGRNFNSLEGIGICMLQNMEKCNFCGIFKRDGISANKSGTHLEEFLIGVTKYCHRCDNVLS